MTQHVSPIEQRSLVELEARCQTETRRFRHTQPSDPRFCLEIFRRALRQSALAQGSISTTYTDEEARAALVRIYSEFIKAHINRAALRSTPIDDLVQQAWLRFWRAANAGLTFQTLESALTYLKQVTISTLIEDQRRERKRWRDESLQQIAETDSGKTLAASDADLFDQLVRQRFRIRCREVLVDPLEYRVFYMRYSMGQPPREIAHVLADEQVSIKGRSPTARAVSDLLDRICKQLCLDPEIRALLEND